MERKLGGTESVFDFSNFINNKFASDNYAMYMWFQLNMEVLHFRFSISKFLSG